MALVVQADYDGASGIAAQFVNKKRANGPNNNKVMREATLWRGYAPEYTTGDPPCNLSVSFVDGSAVVLHARKPPTSRRFPPDIWSNCNSGADPRVYGARSG